MSQFCDHEYVEPVTCDATGDTVSKCCHCDRILGRSEPSDTLPSHWFDHTPRDSPYFNTAGDVIKGELPRDPGEVRRFVHVCGNCQHWLGAVHSHYFENIDESYDRGDIPSFIGQLMESLCPKCGAANFRWGSLVMSYADARFVRKEGINLTKYIHNRADLRYWHGSFGRAGPSEIEMPLRDIGDYNARCPCCGYAIVYGSREFDFHHWDYDDDTGCMLCRDCHSHIHRGMRASEQAELSDTWKADAIRRLYDRATGNGLEFKRGHPFTARFNIPADNDTRQALSNLFDVEQQTVPITEMMPDE